MFLILSGVILLGYWFKNQMDIDLFDSYSLSGFIPFKYLKRNNVLAKTHPNILINESFESHKIFPEWSKLWMREKGKVTQQYDLNGIGNSRCLNIKSESTLSWSYSHNKYIEVQPGDVFHFMLFAKKNSKQVAAYAGVAAFDKNKETIQWNYIKEEVDQINQWGKVEKRFTIPDGIDFIIFRLSGAGVGEYRFDDIFFQKEEKNEP